ncbi:hypothetical protein [Stieleria neptunia]|uniref:hypothetical protein n=1 Tax=Stieleria neptunia TaxID=2527979 RepID=UPI0018D23BC9|nr:hypothetical protein [Stieleria neptunia]
MTSRRNLAGLLVVGLTSVGGADDDDLKLKRFARLRLSRHHLFFGPFLIGPLRRCDTATAVAILITAATTAAFLSRRRNFATSTAFAHQAGGTLGTAIAGENQRYPRLDHHCDDQ